MSRCVYTVNVGWPGKPFLTDLARNSMLAAARRWEADFCEVMIPTQGRIFYTKHNAVKRLSGYDTLLYLDADMLVSDTSPNPFDLCALFDTLYAVSDYQEPNQCEEWRKMVFESIPGFLEAHGAEAYFNVGFLMFNTGPVMLSLFEGFLASLATESPIPDWDIREQSLFNAAAYSHPGVSVKLLGQEWNRIVPKAHVNHFAGTEHALLNRIGFKTAPALQAGTSSQISTLTCL